MKFRRIILFSLVGFLLQVILHIFAIISFAFRKHVLANLYLPWARLGETLDHNSGAGGHAFQGGIIPGYLLGILFYSFLLGVLLSYFQNYFKKVC